jgi:uncharacterized protein
MFSSYYRVMKTNKPVSVFMNTLRREMPFLVERYQVESLGVFGSFVRGAEREGSDLDLLVTFRSPPSLLKLVDLENYLSDLLGVKVDPVMKDALKRRIGTRVLREVVTL